ncbi:uncharacterized protein BDV17DRAFT_138312 [Aspergillus undulatus]|uniref:uncharacterized protein n=1 Tax=Aspergillus undulatus TaxID=1810928 RepID=UPI003CCCC8EF
MTSILSARCPGEARICDTVQCYQSKLPESKASKVKRRLKREISRVSQAQKKTRKTTVNLRRGSSWAELDKAVGQVIDKEMGKAQQTGSLAGFEQCLPQAMFPLFSWRILGIESAESSDSLQWNKMDDVVAHHTTSLGQTALADRAIYSPLLCASLFERRLLSWSLRRGRGEMKDR